MNTHHASITLDLSSPEQLMQTYSRLFNDGDLDGLVGLYEDSAVFQPDPGTVVSGHVAIRGALAEFLALSPTIDARVDQVLLAGDVALVVNDWSLTGSTPDGEPVEQSGHSADVVRRQADGRWLVVVDRP